MQGRSLKIHTSSQGLRRTTPRPAKSLTFRVTRVRPCSRAVAAMTASTPFTAIPRCFARAAKYHQRQAAG